MVCKCCVVDCRSNYAGEERTTVFSFPKEESLRKIWITLNLNLNFEFELNLVKNAHLKFQNALKLIRNYM